MDHLNDTTKNFLEVWNSFKWPEIKLPVYKCYYLDDGTVDYYSMEDFPGNYIEVSNDEYFAAAKPAKVINGKLVICANNRDAEKLFPHQPGTMCHKNDVCVVVDKDGITWGFKE